MSRISVRTHLPALVIALALSGACHNTLSPVNVVGTYALSSTTGTIGRFETPVSGSLVLAPDGSAERRVSYYRDSTTALTEIIEVGTYRVDHSTVYMSLMEGDGQAVYAWRVTATVENSGSLRLAYPRPADGTIVEIYQRQ
jgi:uncharacterized protein YfaP (DUF2135 family)